MVVTGPTNRMIQTSTTNPEGKGRKKKRKKKIKSGKINKPASLAGIACAPSTQAWGWPRPAPGLSVALPVR